MWVTVQLTLLGFVLAFAIGIVVAACRVSPVPPLRAAGTFYVEVFRNIPLIVLFVLRFPQVLRIVVLPQALRSVVAPLGNLFIALVKNSSIAYTISVVELTGVADRLTTETAKPLAVFSGAFVAYLILTIPSGHV